MRAYNVDPGLVNYFYNYLKNLQENHTKKINEYKNIKYHASCNGKTIKKGQFNYDL